MNFSTGCAFNLREMFYKFPIEKLSFGGEITKYRRKLAAKIFKENVKMVIQDIIDNNVTFNLPLYRGKKCKMHMKRYSGKRFIAMRKKGKWRDVDYLKSQFSGYMPVMYINSNGTPREKNIYLNRKLLDKITENTNKGKQYC